ncbi:hypothetical protein DPMN_078880 [Dreissena polymorpha]|uniref:Uncharacterized protein n=1 Tax=Dreissena polymorpha TaxID=45954 RepID=A0A9D4BQM9_DREPO|nr:hypothetical protein DPMN_078880 [Dreissena polymorpha]
MIYFHNCFISYQIIKFGVRRPHDVHGDLTATLPRLYYDYCVSLTSLTERRKTPDFGDHLEHVRSGRRGLAS